MYVWESGWKPHWQGPSIWILNPTLFEIWILNPGPVWNLTPESQTSLFQGPLHVDQGWHIAEILLRWIQPNNRFSQSVFHHRILASTCRSRCGCSCRRSGRCIHRLHRTECFTDGIRINWSIDCRIPFVNLFIFLLMFWNKMLQDTR